MNIRTATVHVLLAFADKCHSEGQLARATADAVRYESFCLADDARLKAGLVAKASAFLDAALAEFRRGVPPSPQSPAHAPGGSCSSPACGL